MNLRIPAGVLFFANLCIFISADVYYAKLHQDEKFICTILSEETLRKFKGFQSPEEDALLIKVKPAIQAPAGDKPQIADPSKIIEIYARKQSVLKTHISTLCKTTVTQKPLTKLQAQPEIQKIIQGGDQSNRIDVVFMGDGYQADEREEFFEDIRRLTKDMFEGVTFRSFLPLFNIWAIHVDSVDSGIGYDGPKNTPFKLYREEGQLRGIYPGNSSYARQVCQLTGLGGCDYPSIIANDDFYGGLGGEFVISTRSNQTGTVVLRHEMGHNFADVGEEYDGGGVYSGVNSAKTVATLGWTSWLTETVKEQRAIYRLQAYVWEDLSKGEISLDFTSDGTYNSWYMIISVTAAGEEDCLEFKLDGVVLQWKSFGSDDREFYDWYGTADGFSSGRHTVTIRSKTNSTNAQIPRMVASVDLHEFGTAAEFRQDNSYISAYPTWDYSGRKTFRPSNAGCLMRNMTHNEFCPVCREGIWYQFLQRISLIDEVVIRPEANPDAPRNVIVETLKLGQLRAPGNEVEGERLEIRWFRNENEVEDFKDQFSIMAEDGTWRVQVELITPEIRSDPNQLLVESETFVI